MHITFENSSDLTELTQLLQSLTGATCHDMEVITENNTLYIKINQNEELTIQTYIVPALAKFILKVKEPEFIRHLLETTFFFHDKSEQQQIIQMLYAIVGEEEASFHPQLREGYRREEILTQALTMFLSQHVYFSFEAFLKFRLKDYYSRLLDYIEVAIDEYKLEQDYQDFIESLRKYIATKTITSFSRVHVVYENERFLFYDENLKSFTYHLEQLEDDFISIKGFEVDQDLVAPLLLLCPKQIDLYVQDLDQGMIQTVINIFQERVTIHPYKRFSELQH
ncbi:putative sporulation protein YtxC [Bacillus pinisoli]|uniref:putative sporulation protein YtxC n=1 Tax=Bacillus pinisoli TaxID=2901866 RepID=UPI001FF4BCB3|nr:putative sporulation protein YtxC [Bacillus pinisoli]